MCVRTKMKIFYFLHIGSTNVLITFEVNTEIYYVCTCVYVLLVGV